MVEYENHGSKPSVNDHWHRKLSFETCLCLPRLYTLWTCLTLDAQQGWKDQGSQMPTWDRKLYAAVQVALRGPTRRVAWLRAGGPARTVMTWADHRPNYRAPAVFSSGFFLPWGNASLVTLDFPFFFLKKLEIRIFMYNEHILKS